MRSDLVASSAAILSIAAGLGGCGTARPRHRAATRRADQLAQRPDPRAKRAAARLQAILDGEASRIARTPGLHSPAQAARTLRRVAAIFDDTERRIAHVEVPSAAAVGKSLLQDCAAEISGGLRAAADEIASGKGTYQTSMQAVGRTSRPVCRRAAVALASAGIDLRSDLQR